MSDVEGEKSAPSQGYGTTLFHALLGVGRMLVLVREATHPSGGIFPVCPNICEKQNRLRKFIDVVILVTDSALSCSSP